MSGRIPIAVTVNGRVYRREVEARRLLTDFLRQDLGLHGTHVGCEQGVCGACTVLLDGEAVKSCLMLAAQAEGHAVTTVEGLAGRGALHPVQEAFGDAHGVQCETRGVVARYHHDTRALELWSSTQTPHLVRHQLAHALRMAESDVRVSAPDVGGGFGLKIGVYPEDIIVSLLAIDTGRPVKWVEDRIEFFRSSVHAREAVHELELGAMRDGALVALRSRYLVDVGAYNGPLGPPLLTTLMLPGPYRVHDGEIERRFVLTTRSRWAPTVATARPNRTTCAR